MENVIILGTDVLDLQPDLYSQANLNHILEGKQPGGQLTTSEVENFPGFPAGVDGFELMNNLRKQATKFGARVENAFIDRVDFSGENKVLYSGEKSYEAKVIIIATGAAPRLLNVPGEKEMYGGKGVTMCYLRWSFLSRHGCGVIGGDSAVKKLFFLLL